MDSPFTEKFRPTKPSEWCLPDRIRQVRKINQKERYRSFNISRRGR